MREFACRCGACQHVHTVTLDGGFKDHGCREQCGCPTQSTGLQAPEDLGDYLKSIGGIGGLQISDKGRGRLKELCVELRRDYGVTTNWNGTKWEAWFVDAPAGTIQLGSTEPEAVARLLEDAKRRTQP